MLYNEKAPVIADAIPEALELFSPALNHFPASPSPMFYSRNISWRLLKVKPRLLLQQVHRGEYPIAIVSVLYPSQAERLEK
ncbi:MAG TPA: hypothetical protein VFO86_05080 [Terriglobia bacterium]|nr:hypothetical protein [Terriglobia bacterium]